MYSLVPNNETFMSCGGKKKKQCASAGFNKNICVKVFVPISRPISMGFRAAPLFKDRGTPPIPYKLVTITLQIL